MALTRKLPGMRPFVAASVVACAAAGLALGAVEQAAPDAPKPVVVLDTTGFWRMHHTLRPPVVQLDAGPRAILYGEQWLDSPTAPPPDNWTDPDFDDSGWVRAVALRACKTPYLSRLCLRGKFEVSDPDRVSGLALTVGYHGGAVVYVNGREVGRAHLPPGDLSENSLADGYPEEAFVMPDGKVITRRSDGPDKVRRQALRERLVENVQIPPRLLRRGVNVVAIDLRRAPYHKIQEQAKSPNRSGQPQYVLSWYTCEIRRVQLTAASADGLASGAARPQGLQVWNSDLLMSDFDLDIGDPCERLRPVKMVVPRNGACSGKVVVGCDQPLRGLKLAAGELKSGAATIPASAVRVRCAIPWDEEWVTIPYSEQIPPYPRVPGAFGALLESPPAVVPVREKPAVESRHALRTPNQPGPVFGAVVPVWITVRVPRDAKPGTYTGRVRLEVQGAPPRDVTVELKVMEWTLPDTQDYQTWVELIESPDTLAMEYGLELWSAEHWRLIEQAMKYIGETCSRTVHVPLIAQTNLGHEQSMVRWIKRGENQYDYDFTILDRYLDAAEKFMGRPRLSVFWVWDIYLIEQEMYHGKDHLILEKAIAARDAMRGTGPRVTVLDPASGKTDLVALPPYKDPASAALWAPLMTKIQERLKARGLEKTMMLGMCNDTRPTKEEVKFFWDILPGVPWASQAHGGFHARSLVGDVAPCGYQARVWNVAFSAEKSLHGWKNPMFLAYYDRDRELTPKTPAFWSHMAEMCITGDQRGVGRLGADYWKAARDKNGNRAGYVWARYPQSSWRNLDLWSYELAPGPDGPVATPHHEYLKEGVQHCEARIFLEQALLDGQLRERLGEELARLCQEALDERQQAMVRSMAHLQMESPDDLAQWRYGTEVAGHMWFVGSGWQERSEKLFALAGDVSRILAGG